MKTKQKIAIAALAAAITAVTMPMAFAWCTPFMTPTPAAATDSNVDNGDGTCTQTVCHPDECTLTSNAFAGCETATALVQCEVYNGVYVPASSAGGSWSCDCSAAGGVPVNDTPQSMTTALACIIGS